MAGQYALTAAGPCSNTTTANRQARSLLTLLNPAAGQYYAANTVAQLYDDARGWYQGVRFGLTEAPLRRLEHQHQLHLQQVHQRRRTRRRGRHRQRLSGADRATSPAAIRSPDASTNKGPCVADRRHNFNLSAVLVSPGLGSGFCETLTKDWQTGIIWQARSGSPITPTTTGDTALTGLPQRPIIVAGRRSEPRRRRPHVGDDRQHAVAGVVQPRGLRAEPGRCLGQHAEGLPVRTGLLERRRVVLAQPELQRRQAHRAPRRGVQPVQPLELGEPDGADRLDRADQRPRHQHHRRSAHHAVRRQVRLLAEVRRSSRNLRSSQRSEVGLRDPTDGRSEGSQGSKGTRGWR